MKKIVVIGNSAAGISAAESVRRRDKEAKVVIVSDEPFLAYDRRRLLDLVAGKARERELYWRAQDFYKNNGFELLLERQVAEVNTAKKKVVFKDKDALEYDDLVIASGLSVALPGLKGISKEGVVAFNGLKDAKYIVDNLPVAHTVIVAGSGELSLAIAGIIASKKIEVKLLGAPSGDAAQPPEGVDIVVDNPISEIIGDAELRAVRLATNKVIGASMLIYAEPRKPRIDFLRESGIRTDEGVLVDEQMRASAEGVYAVGDCAQFADRPKTYGWENAIKEGENLGSFLCPM